MPQCIYVLLMISRSNLVQNFRPNVFFFFFFFFCFCYEQAAGKLVADIKVDDTDTELLTGKQVLQPVDELSDTVLLPSPGMSVVLDLLGNRNISPTRYVALFRWGLLLFRYCVGVAC